MSCLIVGDSLTVGLASVLKGCTVIAHVGWPSATILHALPRTYVDKAYISAGSNDPTNPELKPNLMNIRDLIMSADVVWIAPHNPTANKAVRAVAFMRGDRVRDPIVGKDGVHPKSYVTLKKQVTAESVN